MSSCTLLSHFQGCNSSCSNDNSRLRLRMWDLVSEPAVEPVAVLASVPDLSSSRSGTHSSLDHCRGMGRSAYQSVPRQDNTSCGCNPLSSQGTLPASAALGLAALALEPVKVAVLALVPPC